MKQEPIHVRRRPTMYVLTVILIVLFNLLQLGAGETQIRWYVTSALSHFKGTSRLAKIFINLPLQCVSRLGCDMHASVSCVWNDAEEEDVRCYLYHNNDIKVELGDQSEISGFETSPAFSTVYRGSTSISADDVTKIVNLVRPLYKGKYDIISKNCHVFTRHLIKIITGKNAPLWPRANTKLLSAVRSSTGPRKVRIPWTSQDRKYVCNESLGWFSKRIQWLWQKMGLYKCKSRPLQTSE